jgi:hypothetical protein
VAAIPPAKEAAAPLATEITTPLVTGIPALPATEITTPLVTRIPATPATETTSPLAPASAPVKELERGEAVALPSTPPPPAAEAPSIAAVSASPPPTEDLSTRAFRVNDLFEPSTPTPAAEASPAAMPGHTTAAGDSRATARTAEPSGRTLADLYYAQGHYAEALRIYDDLIEASPFDPELKRLRRDAEARLLPAASHPALAAPDSGLTRRLAKVRALKRWLAVVQTG